MASLPDGSKPDYEKYTYCTVEMEYVPADKITDDETYYEVDTEVPMSLITMRPASMEQCLTHRIHTRR